MTALVKIVQFVTSLAYGDAIGDDVLAMDRILKGAGYDCRVMAITVDERLAGRAENVDFGAIAPDDLIIFHKATGDTLSAPICKLRCKKMVVYHNITPARFFLPYDLVMAWNLGRGRRQLKRLAAVADYACGDSAYNCAELAEAGFKKDRLSVLPILFDINKMKVEQPDAALLKKLRGTPGAKLLFIGRVAPNKKQEDVIKVFYRFLETQDPDAKLYLVGGWQGLEKYYAKLKGFAADLGLTDEQVVFTGRVTDAEKEAYLAAADALVCMSEHEGFCVPLLEAMRRDIPIAAYAAAAVPETLGENGMLFKEKDYAAIAAAIGRMCREPALREDVLRRQRENLRRFDLEESSRQLLRIVSGLAGNGGSAE